MVDGSGVIRHANSKVADFLGVPVQNLVGSPVSDLPIPEASEIDQHEFILRHPAERNLRYTRAPIGSGDQSTGTVISLTDITSEREAARKLKEYEGSIRTLVAAVDARDEYTYGHSERVSEYGVRLGERLGLSRQEIDDLRHGGLLHDIGKIGIDDRILRKSGALTPEERALMMEHPAKGGAILAQAGAFSTIMPIVLYHHEWYGGGGYPTGRQGNQIPLLARITSVADAFDAMTSHRHYRAGMPVEEALLRLEEGIGTQFDPNVVSVFVDGIRSGAIPVLNRPADLPAPATPDAEATGRILPVHRQELRVIYRIALETGLFLDLHRLLPRVLEILSETLGAEQYYVALVSNGDEPPEVVAETSPQGNSGVVEGEIADWVLRTGQPVLFSRHEVPETAHLRPRYDSTGSALGVALESGGRVVGALCCESQDVDRYNQESLYLMKAVASQVASAIQIARYHERVRDSAIRDGLTGAYNHTYFYDEGERRLAEALKHGLPIAVAVLDVNDMKMVNDRHGHLAGDRVLRYYADLLAANIREEDILARCGGDEFMVIMPGLSRTEASMVMSDIVRSVADSIEWNDASIPLAGLAWGVAAHPEDGARLMDLINTADRAMYSQKRSRQVIRLRASG